MAFKIQALLWLLAYVKSMIQKHHMNLTIKQQATNHGSALLTYPLANQKCLIVNSRRQPHREYIETPNV